jgi:hypothetical protein
MAPCNDGCTKTQLASALLARTLNGLTPETFSAVQTPRSDVI